MGDENEYWVVLPSNIRSDDSETKNQADDFKTQLNPPLALDGDWEVGLFKVSYPKTCFDIKLNESDTKPSDSDKTKARGIFSDDHDDYTVTSNPRSEGPESWTVASADKTTRNPDVWGPYEINDSSIIVEIYQAVALPRTINTLSGSRFINRRQYMRTIAHIHLGDLHTARSAQDVADQLNHSFKNNLRRTTSRVMITTIPIDPPTPAEDYVLADDQFKKYGENLRNFLAKDTYDGISLKVADPVGLSARNTAYESSHVANDEFILVSTTVDNGQNVEWADITNETTPKIPAMVAQAFQQIQFYVEPCTQRLALRARGIDDGQGDQILMNVFDTTQFHDQKVLRMKVDVPGYYLRKLLGVKTTHYTLTSDEKTFGVLERGEYSMCPSSCKGLTFPTTVNYISVPRLMVYSDIVRNTHFGPTQASVIAIVENGTVFGQQYSWSASKIMYVPVKTNYIDQIHIVIRDEVGHEVKFEAGSVMLQLHFRKRA